MAFNDLTGGNTFPYANVQWRGKTHILLVTVRSVEKPSLQLDKQQLRGLINATIGVWLRVAVVFDKIEQAIETGEDATWDLDDATAEQKEGLEHSLTPHVTVTNKAYDVPTITVVSNEAPSKTITTIEAQFLSMMDMRQKMPTVFDVKTPPQSNQNQPKQGKIGDSSNPIGANTESTQNTLKLWIRETKPFADGILKIQTGKDNNFDKVAKIEIAYDYKNPPKEDGLYAYVLNNVAWSVGAYTKDNVTTLYVDMPLTSGNIRIFDRGESGANYDWQSLAKHLGHSESQGLRDMAGQSFFVPAAYVVMKKAGNYVNYFGLYS